MNMLSINNKERILKH